MTFFLIILKTEPPGYDLMPSDEFRKTLKLIVDIFDSYKNSVVSLEFKKEDYMQILDCIIEPMIQMSSLSAINLSVVDMAVFMINSVYNIYTMLSLYEYTDKKLEKLEAQVENKLTFIKINYLKQKMIVKIEANYNQRTSLFYSE